MMTRMRLAAGWDHESDFPAEDAAEPMLTPSHCQTAGVKAEIEVQPGNLCSIQRGRTYRTATFIAPGSPEPLPAEKEPVGVCAAVP